MLEQNWKELISPKKLEFERDTLTPTYGKFWAEPFERGFGLTVGNALRRILLGSLQGAAITAVRVEGALHELSTIPGVKEDVTDIVLNLKGVRFLASSPDPRELTLAVEGEREATARDIQVDDKIEVLNPDHHIASLARDGKLRATLYVRVGKGYVASEENKDERLPLGTIAIDSIFSPIRKVNYVVSPARIGQAANYDKLTLEVWTDGSIRPEDAVATAAKILREQVSIFTGLPEEEGEAPAPGPIAHPSITAENLLKPIEELELSLRSANCLKQANVRTVADLVQKSEAEMLKTKNLGRKSLNEIKEILGEMGLALGMSSESLPDEVRRELRKGQEA